MRTISRVVVSGASSFLGSAVVKKLIERGCEVCGIVRPDSTARAWLPNDSHFHEYLCDIGDSEKWSKEIQTADTFFHFAWGGPGIDGRSDPVIQRLSAENTFKAIKAASQLGVSRFFFSGSQAEYGKTRRQIKEETPCHPVLEYGKNKLQVCKKAPVIAEKLRMEYVHARFFSVYGPHDHPYTLIPSCIDKFLNGERMELSECNNMWNFLYVDDAANAVIQLAECELPEPSPVINIASNDTRVLRNFVEEIHRLCGYKGECAFGTRHVSEEPVDNWPDISKLQSIIDWVPKTSFNEGISQLINEKKDVLEK